MRIGTCDACHMANVPINFAVCWPNLMPKRWVEVVSPRSGRVRKKLVGIAKGEFCESCFDHYHLHRNSEREPASRKDPTSDGRYHGRWQDLNEKEVS